MAVEGEAEVPHAGIVRCPVGIIAFEGSPLSFHDIFDETKGHALLAVLSNAVQAVRSVDDAGHSTLKGSECIAAPGRVKHVAELEQIETHPIAGRANTRFDISGYPLHSHGDDRKLEIGARLSSLLRDFPARIFALRRQPLPGATGKRPISGNPDQ